MKRLFLISTMIMISMTMLSTNSCENRQQITGPQPESSESLEAQLDELGRGITNSKTAMSDSEQNNHINYIYKHNTMLVPCGNNFFPRYDWNGRKMSYDECPGDRGIIVSANFIANLWATYVPKNSELGTLACGKPQYPGIPSLSINKSQRNNHPFITWGFKFSHYYEVQRKINNGSWKTIATITNCEDGEGDSNCGNNDYYEDKSVLLSSLSKNYYYRVRLKLFTNSYGEYSNWVTYTPKSLAINISGPSTLKSGESGTFTAKVSGGVSSTYSYKWSKYQYCNGDIDTYGVACGYWRPVGNNSKTLYAAGSRPSFKLKCVVTDINGSATDYHTI